jgi:hypothetical protein
MSFLLDLPVYLSFLIVCAVTVLVSTIGLWFIRKKYSHDVLKEHHEVAAVIFNAFGLLYAVVVAFVVFVVWNRYDEASKNLELEASEAADLFYVVKVFPDSVSKEMRLALHEYTTNVYREELKMMTKGETSQKTLDAIKKLMKTFLSMDVRNLPNEPAYEEAFKRFNSLTQYRRLRIFAAGNSVPNVIWMVLLIGAFITVSYTYFFGVKKVWPQNLMTAALTITITLILFLIFILDHPYSGSNAISSEPMQKVMESMEKTIHNI